MKKYFLTILAFYTSLALSDPHYVQALHPYWGSDDSYRKYLDEFSGPVSVDAKKYGGKHDPDVGYDMYIYIYVIKHPNSSSFSLDLHCPGEKSYRVNSANNRPTMSDFAKIELIFSDPVAKNPKAEINTDKSIEWKLSQKSEAQGMWFYSESPPTKRRYTLKTSLGDEISEVIDGPSCKQ